jgi:hypothetical protein
MLFYKGISLYKSLNEENVSLNYWGWEFSGAISPKNRGTISPEYNRNLINVNLQSR